MKRVDRLRRRALVDARRNGHEEHIGTYREADPRRRLRCMVRLHRLVIARDSASVTALAEATETALATSSWPTSRDLRDRPSDVRNATRRTTTAKAEGSARRSIARHVAHRRSCARGRPDRTIYPVPMEVGRALDVLAPSARPQPRAFSPQLSYEILLSPVSPRVSSMGEHRRKHCSPVTPPGSWSLRLADRPHSA